jgi:hypothetical protein
MTRGQRSRLEALERAAGAGDEWAGHPDADLYCDFPWMAFLSDDELAQGVDDDAAMDELQAIGEARRAAAKLEVCESRLAPPPVNRGRRG